jgi:2-methylisocitrate lyase-like PEP mutase family enzyme
MTQAEKAIAFRALHVKGDPIILFNIWDAGSAKAVAKQGAKALATGSASVAMAFGFADGEKMPLDLACENFARIVAATDLPVTMDLEGGYGVDAATVSASVTAGLKAGAIGLNFEDQIVGGEGMHAMDAQAVRIAAARKAADDFGVPAFVNARTDVFLKAKPETHSDAMLDEAIARAAAYADAGADGFFAPGLKDEAMIERLCREVALPINIMALPGTPPNEKLAALGVARISYGPVPYRQMMAALGEAAQAVMG